MFFSHTLILYNWGFITVCQNLFLKFHIHLWVFQVWWLMNLATLLAGNILTRTLWSDLSVRCGLFFAFLLHGAALSRSQKVDRLYNASILSGARLAPGSAHLLLGTLPYLVLVIQAEHVWEVSYL